MRALRIRYAIYIWLTAHPINCEQNVRVSTTSGAGGGWAEWAEDPLTGNM